MKKRKLIANLYESQNREHYLKRGFRRGNSNVPTAIQFISTFCAVFKV